MKMAEIKTHDLEEDLYSCVQCGYCQDVCPIYNEIPWESASPRGKLYWIKSILTTGFMRPSIQLDEDLVDRLFQCTLCGRCHEVCQTSLDTMGIWKSARAEVFKSGMRPKNLESIAGNLEESMNPYGLDADMRLDWADYTDLEEVPEKDEAAIAFFVGCTTAFKGANHGIGYSIATLLTHIGEDWTLLGEDEWCCGGPLIMSGDEEGAKVFVEHNIAELGRRAVKTLITGCPACFRMWKIEIPELLGKDLGFEVLHSLEFFNQRVEEGKLVLPDSDDVLTYHDPCELSRLCGVVDEPRKLLGGLSSGFVEMPENGVDVMCCGGGGLLQASDNMLRLSIAKRRIEQAKSVGAGLITSACPACNLTLKDGVGELEENIEVLDLVEYMVKKLGLD